LQPSGSTAKVSKTANDNSAHIARAVRSKEALTAHYFTEFQIISDTSTEEKSFQGKQDFAPFLSLISIDGSQQKPASRLLSS
jgi:hypothetical protein